MVNHSGQFERVKGLFSSVFEAGEAVKAYVVEVPTANCRVHVYGDKKGEKAGSIRVHGDLKGGTVFNERLRLCASWRIDAGQKMSREERRQKRMELAVKQAERVQRELLESRENAFTASMILRECVPAINHPYLIKKRITPTSSMFEIDASTVDAIMSERGIRSDKGIAYRTGLSGRLLVIPLCRGTELCSLQFIEANGRKRFMKGGRVGGAYWLSQPIEAYQCGRVIGIAEGVATARSVELVEGVPCVASMSSGNLRNVAVYLVNKFPDKHFWILSDVGNGEEDARKAGEAIGGLVTKPPFTPDIVRDFKAITGSDNPTDWNDFCIATGRLGNG